MQSPPASKKAPTMKPKFQIVKVTLLAAATLAVLVGSMYASDLVLERTGDLSLGVLIFMLGTGATGAMYGRLLSHFPMIAEAFLDDDATDSYDAVLARELNRLKDQSERPE